MTTRRRSRLGTAGQGDRQRSATNRDNSPRQTDAESAGEQSDGEILPAEVIEALEDKGVDLQNPGIRKAVSVTASVTHMHQGPIPSAATLGEYDAIRPGTSDKIIEWADMQIRHRLERENYASRGLNEGLMFHKGMLSR
jgi:hypothetical protein